VKVAPECSLGGQSGVELPHRARKWLGLRAIAVSPDGTVTPRTPAGIGGTVSKAPVSAAGAGRLGAGLKMAGGSLIAVGVSLLCAYLRGKLDEAAIERGMKALEPKIQAMLKASAARITDIQAKGCLPVANISVTITVYYTLDPEDGNYDASLPWVEPDALKVNISDQVLEGAGQPVRTRHGIGQYSESTPFTYSVVLSDPELIALGLRVCKAPVVQLKSDTEIRDWLARTPPIVIRSLPAQEKIRMINRLLDGWISDADVKGIDKICANAANSSELAAIRVAIQPRETSISDLGQRTRVRVALQRR
jgi:hypothetical protein